MRYLFIPIVVLALFSSCNSQPAPYQEALKVKDAILEARPGTTPTKPGEFTMTAKINGKEWSASSMMPANISGRTIGYYGEDFISMPKFEKKFLRLGKKEVFGTGNAVEISIDDNPRFYSGKTGEMEVTKIDGEWIEASFFFTATTDGSSKSVKVTDGFVRFKYDN